MSSGRKRHLGRLVPKEVPSGGARTVTLFLSATSASISELRKFKMLQAEFVEIKICIYAFLKVCKITG